jgi:hypothetical protein
MYVNKVLNLIQQLYSTFDGAFWAVAVYKCIFVRVTDANFLFFCMKHYSVKLKGFGYSLQRE